MSPAAAIPGARATIGAAPGSATTPAMAAEVAAIARGGDAEPAAAAIATVLRLAEAGRVLDAASAATAAGFLSPDRRTALVERVADAAAAGGLDAASAAAAVANVAEQATEVRALQAALAGGGPCGEGDAADGGWALVHGPLEESAWAASAAGGGRGLPPPPPGATAPRVWYRRLAGGGHSLRLDGVVAVGLCPLAALLYEVDLYEQLFWFVRAAAALVPAAALAATEGAAATTTAEAAVAAAATAAALTTPAIDAPLLGGGVRALLSRSIGLHLPVPWPMSDRVAGLVGYGVDDFDGGEGRPPALYIRCRSIEAAADGLAIPPFGRLTVPAVPRPPPTAGGRGAPADAAAVAAATAAAAPAGGYPRSRPWQAAIAGGRAPSSSTHRVWPRRPHSRRRSGSGGSPRRPTAAAAAAGDARGATPSVADGVAGPPTASSAAAAVGAPPAPHPSGSAPSLLSRASARLWAAAPAALTPAAATTADAALEMRVAPSGMALHPLSPTTTRVVAVVSADPGLPTPPAESLVRWVAGAVAAAALRALEERGADLPRLAPAHAARVAAGGVYAVLEARLAEVWARQGELPVGKKHSGGEDTRHC